MHKIRYFLFWILISCRAHTGHGQLTLQNKLVIDSILSQWSIAKGPGMVLAITSGDHIVYTKGFGFSNLELKTPITSNSVFNLASVTKQFTGYAIAKLIADHKLQLQDPIRRYLPWLPACMNSIVLNNLVYHTSGILDDMRLYPFVGPDNNGIFSQQRVLDLIKRQEVLSFVPGEKFSYCNANYILLAEIIKAVTGKGYATYLKEEIFEPLEMRASHMGETAFEVIPERVSSYWEDKGTYFNFLTVFNTQGNGGMYSTVEDLSKWMIYLYKYTPDSNNVIRLFCTQGKLRNSKWVPYGMGIVTDEFLGHKRWMHKGGLAGFKNFLAVYPEQKIGIVVLSNANNGPKVTATMDAIASVLLSKGKDSQSIGRNLPPSKKLRVKALSKLAGNYVADNGEQICLRIKNDALFNGDDRLISLTERSLVSSQNLDVSYEILQLKKPAIRRINPGPNPPDDFIKIKEGESLPPDNLAGTYYNETLNFTFKVEVSDGKLWGCLPDGEKFECNTAGAGHFYTEIDYMSHFLIRKDELGIVKGLELAVGDIAGLTFRKGSL